MFQHAHEATTDDIVSSIIFFLLYSSNCYSTSNFFIINNCHVFPILDAIFIQKFISCMCINIIFKPDPILNSYSNG